MFSDLHEVFFCDFPHLLKECLLRLKYKPCVLLTHRIWYKVREMGATCQGGVIAMYLPDGRW
jgi:hypothetical protein